MQQDVDSPPNYESLGSIGHHRPPQHARGKSTHLRTSIWVMVCVLVLVGGFVAGMQYQKSKSGSAQGVANSQYERFGSGMRQQSGGIGTVTAVSGSSITIAERSFRSGDSSTGSSKTYAITDSTQIIKDGTAATTSDIQDGDTVFVRTSGDGSTTAREITINPTLGGGPSSAPSAPSDDSGTTDPATATDSI